MKVNMNTCAKKPGDVEEGNEKSLFIHIQKPPKCAGLLNAVKIILCLELILLIGWLGFIGIDTSIDRARYQSQIEEYDSSNFPNSSNEIEDSTRLAEEITSPPVNEDDSISVRIRPFVVFGQLPGPLESSDQESTSEVNQSLEEIQRDSEINTPDVALDSSLWGWFSSSGTTDFNSAESTSLLPTSDEEIYSDNGCRSDEFLSPLQPDGHYGPSWKCISIERWLEYAQVRSLHQQDATEIREIGSTTRQIPEENDKSKIMENSSESSEEKADPVTGCKKGEIWSSLGSDGRYGSEMRCLPLNIWWEYLRVRKSLENGENSEAIDHDDAGKEGVERDASGFECGLNEVKTSLQADGTYGSELRCLSRELWMRYLIVEIKKSSDDGDNSEVSETPEVPVFHWPDEVKIIGESDEKDPSPIECSSSEILTSLQSDGSYGSELRCLSMHLWWEYVKSQDAFHNKKSSEGNEALEAGVDEDDAEELTTPVSQYPEDEVFTSLQTHGKLDEVSGCTSFENCYVKTLGLHEFSGTHEEAQRDEYSPDSSSEYTDYM